MYYYDHLKSKSANILSVCVYFTALSHTSLCLIVIFSNLNPSLHFQQFWQPGLTGPSTSQDIKPFGPGCYGPGKAGGAIVPGESNLQAAHTWEGRSIATHKFRLVEFSAYLELRVEEAVSQQIFLSKTFIC